MAGFLSLVRRAYLSLYNWAVFIGWGQVLYLTVKTLRESSYKRVYDAVERPLILAQTAAILEIIHSIIGIVRSPISATLPQIGSRLFLVWGILFSFPEVRTHFLVTSLVLSWSITEIIRYSFFGMKEVFGFTPSWLLWLRYSTFLLFYPTGISSEVGLALSCLQYIKASEKYCVRLPNKWNFSFDYYYACILVLLIYVPGLDIFPLLLHNNYWKFGIDLLILLLGEKKIPRLSALCLSVRKSSHVWLHARAKEKGSGEIKERMIWV